MVSALLKELDIIPDDVYIHIQLYGETSGDKEYSGSLCLILDHQAMTFAFVHIFTAAPRCDYSFRDDVHSYMTVSWTRMRG